MSRFMKISHTFAKKGKLGTGSTFDNQRIIQIEKMQFSQMSLLIKTSHTFANFFDEITYCYVVVYWKMEAIYTTIEYKKRIHLRKNGYASLNIFIYSNIH